MGRCLVLTSCLVGLISGTAYYLGLFDRPPFAFHSSLISTSTDEENEIFAIMAFTRSPDIGSHIGRMLQDTKNLLDENPTAKAAMKSASKLYNAPEDVDSLAVGLYFDNPSVVPDPRWGVGWTVAAPSFDDVEPIRAAVDTFYEGEEEIRKVRIGLHGPGLRARIPWRTMLTPMIAPMIHWNRAHAYLLEGGYSATSKELGVGMDACVFSEFYVSSHDDTTHHYIDYIALLGDTTNMWEDSFPSENKSSSSSSASSSNMKEDDNLNFENESDPIESVPSEDVSEL
jgi:hypothetical protein